MFTERAVHVFLVSIDKQPLFLQDHGSAVRFRNIWLRELEPRADD